jgi:hypothetical protein
MANVFSFRRRTVQLQKLLRVCLQHYEQFKTIQDAQRLRSAVLPSSELVALSRMPDGIWLAELRYDNLLHEGWGESEAAAVVDAVAKIVETIC